MEHDKTCNVNELLQEIRISVLQHQNTARENKVTVSRIVTTTGEPDVTIEEIERWRAKVLEKKEQVSELQESEALTLHTIGCIDKELTQLDDEIGNYKDSIQQIRDREGILKVELAAEQVGRDLKVRHACDKRRWEQGDEENKYADLQRQLNRLKQRHCLIRKSKGLALAQGKEWHMELYEDIEDDDVDKSDIFWCGL